MQYLLRFILASYVVLFHTGSYYFPNAGPFAVFGFYTLSGYLITKVLNERYYAKSSPMRDFFVNRFWRLYPTYFVAAGLGAVLAWLAADQAAYWNNVIRLPDPETEMGWVLTNISIMGLHLGIPVSSPIRFAPPAWSTAIEIYFYIFLFFVGARSEQITIKWLKLSILTCLVCGAYLLGIANPSLSPGDLIYNSVFGVSLCFALGAVTYFLGKRRKTTPSKIWGDFAFLCCVTLPIIPWRSVLTSETLLMFLHYSESISVAVFLYSVADTQLGRWSTWLGDISYPLFLVHWQVAILLTATGLSLIKSDVGSMLIIYIAAVLVSASMVYLIEQPLKAVRKRIRERN